MCYVNKVDVQKTRQKVVGLTMSYLLDVEESAATFRHELVIV